MFDSKWVVREYALGSERKEIMIFHPDIEKDRKDVVFVRYSLIGIMISIVLVVTIN